MRHQNVIIPFILVCITITFLIISSPLAWYRFQLQTSAIDATIDFYLVKQVWTFTIFESSSTVSTNWADTNSFPNLKEVYAYCGSFTFVGFVLFIIIGALLFLQLLCRICSSKRHTCGSKIERVILMISSIIGEICLLIGCFMLLRQPSALKDDYDKYTLGVSCQDACQSFKGSDGGYTWGPETGWWLDIVACFFGLLSTIFIFRKKEKRGYFRI